MMNAHPPAPSSTLAGRIAQAGRDRPFLMKVMRFGLVGVVNTGIDLGVFLLAYNVVGLPLILANVTSWFVAVSCSYVMNSSFTFAAETGGKLTPRDYATFLFSGIAGVVGNTATLVIASYWLPVLYAKLLSIIASFIINFTMSHFIVFRPRKAERTGDEI
jgi:putative flippase GtrA